MGIYLRPRHIDETKPCETELGIPDRISSGGVFMMNIPAQAKLLHTWIILVIVKQRLTKID